MKMNIGKIYPIDLNEQTAYLAGVIVGDGHISGATKSKQDKSPDYNITIEVVDLDFLSIVASLIKGVINTKSVVKKTKPRIGKQQGYYFQFRNKSFYHFRTNDLGIPSGKKCFSVDIPTKILSSPILQRYFLAGLFDTDGGVRGETIGFTSASKKLIFNTIKILNDMNILHHTESWKNKKYNRHYYGIRVKAKDNDKFLNELPLKNNEKLKKVFRHADVLERSNGMVDSLTKIKN